METRQVLDAFAALSEATGLAAFRLLLRAEPEGMEAARIAERLGVIRKTASEHLKALESARLVSPRRDGRAVRYVAAPDTLRAIYDVLMADCCEGNPELCDPDPPRAALPFERIWAAGRRFNVLFLCTQNSARSIIAEAIMNHDHGARFRAFSAGSHPGGEVSADALALLERLGYPVDGLRSKSWEAFTEPEAPNMDFVFTVCDDAAAEQCPVWPGAPMSAHWGVPDPRAVTGDATRRRLAHLDAFRMLERRIGIFANLPFASLERTALKTRLDRIGVDDANAAARPD